MEVRELGNAMLNAETVARGVTAAALYPAGTSAGAGALVAVDVWELQPGASLAAQAHPEEQVVYVLAGEGELLGEDGGATVHVRPNTCVYIGPGERVSLQNAGREVLRVLVTTPMLVRSSRAAGIGASGRLGAGETEPRVLEAARPAEERRAVVREAAPEPVAPQAEEETPPPNIEGMMRRASELKGQPKPERRRPPQPEPEEAPPQQDQPEAQAEGEAEEEEESRMDLLVVFDAGTRGAAGGPGEGFGRYLVQAPSRKPAIRRVELGDDFTPIQAEYRVLIECLSYVAERLTTTGRSPEGVQLDIRSGSEQVVNQLLGTMKIKEPNVRRDHAEAMELLGQFAEWSVAWEKPEEVVRLFGG